MRNPPPEGPRRRKSSALRMTGATMAPHSTRATQGGSPRIFRSTAWDNDPGDRASLPTVFRRSPQAWSPNEDRRLNPSWIGSSRLFGFACCRCFPADPMTVARVTNTTIRPIRLPRRAGCRHRPRWTRLQPSPPRNPRSLRESMGRPFRRVIVMKRRPPLPTFGERTKQGCGPGPLIRRPAIRVRKI